MHVAADSEVATWSSLNAARTRARSLRSYVAQRLASDMMTAEERAALEAPTAAAKKEAVAAARVAAAAAAAAAAQDAARRRCGSACVRTRAWCRRPCAGFAWFGICQLMIWTRIQR